MQTLSYSFIQLDAFGQTYPGASYVIKSSVLETYLRWISRVGTQKRPPQKRVASNHLRFHRDPDDAPIIIGLSDFITPDIFVATIWSSQAFEDGCVICHHVAQNPAASLDAEAQQYHRTDMVPKPVAGDSDISIDQVMAEIDGPSMSTGYESFPCANNSSMQSAASSSSSETEDGQHVAEEAANDASSQNDAAPNMQSVEDDSAAHAISHRQGIKVALAPTTSSLSSVDARGAWPTHKLDAPVADPARLKNISDLRLQTSEYIDVDVQSLHEETNNDSLHRAVEDLAAVVRNLAAQVRGNSESIASLAAIVKQDHDTLTKMCSQQDKVIQNLAAALARQPQAEEEHFA